MNHTRSFNCRFYAALFFCLMLFLITLVSCKYGLNEFLKRGDDVNDRSNNLKNVVVPYDPAQHGGSLLPQEFNVLILTDMHFGAKDNPPIDELLSWIDSLDSTLLTPPVFDDKPSFCLVLGDLVESGTEAQYKEYAEFVQKLDTRGIKTYAVAGNHDLYNSGWTHWERYAAPHTSYYRFVINNVSWYFLDSANGSLGSSQLYNFVDKAHADSNAKLIFTHYPVYAGGVFYFSMSNPRERAVLLDTFARNNAKLVLDGHNHEGSSYNFGSFQEVNLKAFTEKKKWYMLSIDTGNTVSGTLELRDYGL